MELGDNEKSPLFPKKENEPVKLKRTVGVLSASALVFGSCVGAGIFISPKGVYEKAGSPGAGLMVWCLSGVIATLCTLAYAELGTMMPQSGGEFVYIHRVYGDCLAFIFSFCNTLLIKPASLSVVAVLFGEYLCNMIWGPATNDLIVKAVAVALIVTLGLINIVGVNVIAKVCTVISVLKLAVVGFLVACGIAIVIKGQGVVTNFQLSLSFEGSSTNPADYGLAFYYCLFTFQSWNSLNYMTEELKTPEKTLPLGGFIGLTGVTLSYFLCNVAYLMMFSLHQIVDTNTIAMDSGFIAFGRAGEITMSLGLLVSCLGCLGGAICCISRNIQSTAETGIFPSFLSGINKTFQTPIKAIITVVLTMSVYVLVDANMLIPFLSTVEWLFYCVTFSTILYLRYKEPNSKRPFKVPLFVSVFLFLITGTFVVLPLFSEESRVTTLLGLCWIPLGAVFYGIRHLIARYLVKQNAVSGIL
ncbi:cystine/glutamate transporter-like isoform X2 [Bolinopsis microptera]|uniref:cystine/glutamate transporter-like isoform X2 n=1 Tax=Bolinopsis microptera TaxID=2820187 RepID=UPI003079AB3D